MRHRLTLAALLVLCSAGPATLPTTSPTSFPAMQRRLAELVATVEAMGAKIASLEKENAALRDQVKSAIAALPKPPAEGSSDAKWKMYHKAALEKLRRGMDTNDLAGIVGMPIEKLRENDDVRWVYRVGNYELNVWVKDNVVQRFVERGDTPLNPG